MRPGALLISAALLAALAQPARALDPRKSLTQYALTTWTEANGLPQDTIRAIAQTTDGYLWLGTDEGLARFDGYEFSVFNKTQGQLPADSIAALAATTDGALWIGTSSGLTLYRDKQFHTFTSKDGLPDNAITDLTVDHTGALWIVAGAILTATRTASSPPTHPGKRFRHRWSAVFTKTAGTSYGWRVSPPCSGWKTAGS